MFSRQHHCRGLSPPRRRLDAVRSGCVLVATLLGIFAHTATANGVIAATRIEISFAAGSAALSQRDLERLGQVVSEVGALSLTAARISVAAPGDGDRRAMAQSILAKRLGRAGAYDHDMMSMDDISNLFAHYRHAFKSDPRDLLPPHDPGVARTRQEEQAMMVDMARERLLEIMPIDERALSRLTQARLGALQEVLVAGGISAQTIHATIAPQSSPSPGGVSAWVVLERRAPPPN